MALDLMPVHKFDGQMVAGVNILLVLELIIVPQWMLNKKGQFLMKVRHNY